MYHVAKEMGGGNFLFALKAGVLTSEASPHDLGQNTDSRIVILSLPSFLQSSAEFAYSACICHVYVTLVPHDYKETNLYGLCESAL